MTVDSDAAAYAAYLASVPVIRDCYAESVRRFGPEKGGRVFLAIIDEAMTELRDARGVTA